MPRPRTFVLALLAMLALVASISALAWAGGLPHWPLLSKYDWVLHALLVGPLGMLVDGALGFRDIVRSRAPRLAATLALPLGPTLVFTLAAVEEYLQRFSARRTSTWHDFAANTIGIIAFAALGRLLWRRPHLPSAR